jgi:hypothetical protein
MDEAQKITEITKQILSDDELVDVVADWVKKLYDKLIERGFSEEQALTIVTKSQLMGKG